MTTAATVISAMLAIVGIYPDYSDSSVGHVIVPPRCTAGQTLPLGEPQLGIWETSTTNEVPPYGRISAATFFAPLDAALQRSYFPQVRAYDPYRPAPYLPGRDLRSNEVTTATFTNSPALPFGLPQNRNFSTDLRILTTNSAPAINSCHAEIGNLYYGQSQSKLYGQGLGLSKVGNDTWRQGVNFDWTVLTGAVDIVKGRFKDGICTDFCDNVNFWGEPYILSAPLQNAAALLFFDSSDIAEVRSYRHEYGDDIFAINSIDYSSLPAHGRITAKSCVNDAKILSVADVAYITDREVLPEIRWPVYEIQMTLWITNRDNVSISDVEQGGIARCSWHPTLADVFVVTTGVSYTTSPTLEYVNNATGHVYVAQWWHRNSYAKIKDIMASVNYAAFHENEPYDFVIGFMYDGTIGVYVSDVGGEDISEHVRWGSWELEGVDAYDTVRYVIQTPRDFPCPALPLGVNWTTNNACRPSLFPAPAVAQYIDDATLQCAAQCSVRTSGVRRTSYGMAQDCNLSLPVRANDITAAARSGLCYDMSKEMKRLIADKASLLAGGETVMANVLKGRFPSVVDAVNNQIAHVDTGTVFSSFGGIEHVILYDDYGTVTNDHYAFSISVAGGEWVESDDPINDNTEVQIGRHAAYNVDPMDFQTFVVLGTAAYPPLDYGTDVSVRLDSVRFSAATKWKYPTLPPKQNQSQ